MKFGSNWHKRTADKSGVETKFHCFQPAYVGDGLTILS
jgi:hypothetical protein